MPLHTCHTIDHQGGGSSSSQNVFPITIIASHPAPKAGDENGDERRGDRRSKVFRKCELPQTPLRGGRLGEGATDRSQAPQSARLCSSAQLSSVQFSSRWYLWAREGPYAPHPVSQEFSPMLPLKQFQCRSSIDDGPFSSCQGRSLLFLV